MRASDPVLEVFVSAGKLQPHREGPNATWIEPEGSEDDYLSWARGMISANRIDILIPTRKRSLLAGAGLECRVEVPASSDILTLLDDKFAFAARLEGEAYHLKTRLVSSADALAAAIASFAGSNPNGPAPCVKPRRGVNGQGFWQLLRDGPMSHLDDPDNRMILDRLYLAAVAAAEEAGTFQELVLMEYLPGPEVSLDILAHQGALLKLAARTKLASDVQRIQTGHFLASAASDLVGRFGLHGVINAQFRQADDSSWKLLEINARPAGGIVYSEQVGCGLLADWAALLTGRKRPEQISAAHIDTHIRLTTAITQIAA
ncbi:MAG: ATP-grasp domain-containing protein [Sphingomonas sp.]